MCVILVAQDKPLPLKMVRQAIRANPDGNGLAWIEKDGRKKIVRYEKGFMMHDALQYLRDNKIPLPYVFHARIASIGDVTARLTHPFVVGPRSEQMRLGGVSRKGVLFHNGTWHDWDTFYKKIPEGLWSDSRAMADLVHEYGEGFISEVIPETQKIARVTTRGVHLYGAGWVEVGKGILASNGYFLRIREPEDGGMVVL